MWFSKKTFLTWPEYSHMVQETEMMHFISTTTLKSANNCWKKEGVKR